MRNRNIAEYQKPCMRGRENHSPYKIFSCRNCKYTTEAIKIPGSRTKERVGLGRGGFSLPPHLNFLNGLKFVFPGLFQIIRFKTDKNNLTSKFSLYHHGDGLLHSKYIRLKQ